MYAMKTLIALSLLFLYKGTTAPPASAERFVQLSASGQRLQQFYLGMNVENLWIAGNHINWETGEADKPEASSGNHTHCSAFAAAACKRLGVYLLCPPAHGQILLANAQYDWLQNPDAQAKGWSAITGNDRPGLYIRVQEYANKGWLVVAVCKNPDASKPGHVALVMPKQVALSKIGEGGPVVTMAGTHNFNYISLKNGFKSHLSGWPEYEVLFFFNNSKLF